MVEKLAGGLREGVKATLLAGVLLAISSGISSATVITFNFNQSGPAPNLAVTATNSAVQTYMNAVLGAAAAGSVTVTGAAGSGVVNGQIYNGDGFVIGDTLGTSDNGVHHGGTQDNFILNDTAHSATTIDMTFTQTIYNVSFDWEIFPDNTCPSASKGNSCAGGEPDLTFVANGATVQNWIGTAPSNGAAPQAIGTFSKGFTGGVTHLQFVDWPVAIGIDNLVISTTPPPPPPPAVPEPGSIVLLGTGLVFTLSKLRKRMARS
jgi:hypothetical protein